MDPAELALMASLRAHGVVEPGDPFLTAEDYIALRGDSPVQTLCDLDVLTVSQPHNPPQRGNEVLLRELHRPQSPLLAALDELYDYTGGILPGEIKVTMEEFPSDHWVIIAAFKCKDSPTGEHRPIYAGIAEPWQPADSPPPDGPLALPSGCVVTVTIRPPAAEEG